MNAKAKPTTPAQPTQPSAQPTQATPEPRAWFTQDAFGPESHTLLLLSPAMVKLQAALNGIAAIATTLAEHHLKVEGETPLFHNRTLSGMNQAIGALTSYAQELTEGTVDRHWSFVAEQGGDEWKELLAWQQKAHHAQRLRRAYATTQIHQQMEGK